MSHRNAPEAVKAGCSIGGGSIASPVLAFTTGSLADKWTGPTHGFTGRTDSMNLF
jgi:hypothetical protein